MTCCCCPGESAPQEQFIVDVNAATANHVGTCAPSCALSTAISAEITTPAGTPIVAERELFFHYTHSANGRQVLAMGGTDVTGQSGTTVPSSYSFAERLLYWNAAGSQGGDDMIGSVGNERK